MADRAIGDLNFAPGTVDDSNTLFVVQQAGAAYKLSGHNFILALTSILDGHGGVKSITYDAPVSPSLTGTMTITLADDSTTTVSVTNGKGITSISKTGTSGLVDTYTISYNDGTTQNFTVTNGAKGDTGDAWYVWIRYAGQRPTSDSDIGTVPDDWIGIYSGTASTAPTSYTAYSWYEYKGEKGDTGTAASITQQSVTYQESSSGTVAPSGSWVENIPSVTPGNFLWTRTVLEFNDGTSVTSYSVSRYGIDGTGAVSSVNGVSPDINGNVALTATNVPTSDNRSIQAHITEAEADIDDLQTDVGTLHDDMTAAQSDIADLNTAINNLDAEDVGAMSEWVLLWENASPTSNFAAQTIQFDYTRFTHLLVIVKNRTDQGACVSVICRVTDGGVSFSKNTLMTSETKAYFQFRVGYIVGNGIQFENALECDTSAPKGYTSNAVLIPLAVYGIKGVIS